MCSSTVRKTDRPPCLLFGEDTSAWQPPALHQDRSRKDPAAKKRKEKGGKKKGSKNKAGVFILEYKDVNAIWGGIPPRGKMLQKRKKEEDRELIGKIYAGRGE